MRTSPAAVRPARPARARRPGARRDVLRAAADRSRLRRVARERERRRHLRPRLTRSLPVADAAGQGAFLPEYYGVTHLSLGNYIALVSGQGSNPQTQADCQFFTRLHRPRPVRPRRPGAGPGVRIPVQRADRRRPARGARPHVEGLHGGHGQRPRRARADSAATRRSTAATTRRRRRPTTSTRPGTTRSSTSTRSSTTTTTATARRAAHAACPATSRRRAQRRTSASSRPTYVTTATTRRCANGEPGGLVSADAWLREWVPRITGSPAFKRDGLLLVTFDEAEARARTADASACCNQAQFPNTPNNGGPMPGRGGGRVGAVALSPFIRPRHGHRPRLQPLLDAAHGRAAVRPAAPRLRRHAQPGQLRRGRLHAEPLR